MGIPTSVLVRVQARGGKFLGPDIGYSLVSVRDEVSGRLLAQGIAAGDSGQLCDAYAPGASLATIVTPPQPPHTPRLIQWLSPTPPVSSMPQAPPATRSPTAGLLATFDLAAPTPVRISATGLTDGAPNQHRTSARMWLWPGAQLTAEPGLVLEMPGLAVDLLAPAVGQAPTSPLTIQAWVTMMCGCKISPTLSWLPGEFTVTASVVPLAGGAPIETPLTFQTTSVFGATVDLPAPGEYRLIVRALQPATANSGSASTFFTWAASG